MARPIIEAFAAAMEAKLAQNDGAKGEWRARGTYGLLYDLAMERNELVDAVWTFVAEVESSHRAERMAALERAVLAEAADVALYALMVADVLGALPPTEDRGRRYAERGRVSYGVGYLAGGVGVISRGGGDPS